MDVKFSKILKNRYTQLGILFFFLFMVLFGRLAYLQLTMGSEYEVASQQVVTRIIPEKAVRGTIYAEGGEKLAWNRPSFNVDLYYYELIKGDGNSSILNVVETIEKRGGEVIYQFPIAIDRDGNFYFDWTYGNDQEELTEEQESSRESTWKEMHDLSEELTAKECFEELKKVYDIDPKYTDHEALKILNIWNEMKLVGFRAYQPVTIAKDIDLDTVAAIEESGSEHPGVVVTPSSIREYPNGEMAAHVLGYMGKITGEEWEKNKEYYKEKGYDPAIDLIGRSEIEKVMEEYLRGVDGGKRVEVDALGRTIRTVEEKKAQPGNNVYLTLDYELQKVAETALRDVMKKIRSGELGESFPNAKMGSVVVMDVKSGAILAMANEPAFDPNFSVTGKISGEVWEKYNPIYKKAGEEDEIDLDLTLPRPMFNTAIRGAYPPGSTYKMLTGIAALEEGEVTPYTQIVDKGRYTKISKDGPACWIWNNSRGTHGPENIIAALRDSCNYYFYEVGNRLGIDNLEKHARMFGFGEKTGIELPGEAVGTVAGKSHTENYLRSIVSRRIASLAGENWGDLETEQKDIYMDIAQSFIDQTDLQYIQERFEELNIEADRETVYDRIYRYISDNRWTDGKTLSAAIGQAENTATPLQMASYMATLANGGTRYRAYLVDRVEDTEGEVLLKNEPEVLEKVPMDEKNHRAIMEGMRAVVSNSYEGIYGTGARYFRDFPIAIGGKTGTAQFKGHDPYAWFVSFAPFDDPEIAVAVVIGQGGHGSYASIVCRAIYEEYFELGENMVQ